MWLLLPFAAAAGAGIYELLRPTPKSEVVQFISGPNADKMIDVNSRGLQAAGIDFEINTDGVNQWIMVKPKDRTAAVQVVLATARNAGLIK